MDVTLARTFLEILAAGNFVGAANRLNVTQSAISNRMRTLEDLLGRQLLVRSKAGVELTAAGEQFQRYAASMLRVWEQAKQQIGVPSGFRSSIVIGTQYSLWNELLLAWPKAIQGRIPDLAVRAELGTSDRLMRLLLDGLLDIAVTSQPELRPGLNVEPLFEEYLVLVSTRKSTKAHDLGDDYIFMDWGPEFQAAHALRFPEMTNPGMTLALGSLGVQYILAQGGSGYFPEHAVRNHLKRRKLYLVDDAPVFPWVSYIVHHRDIEEGLLSAVLEELRGVIATTLEAQTEVIAHDELAFFDGTVSLADGDGDILSINNLDSDAVVDAQS